MKKEAAKNKAKLRERQQRLEARREQREALKQQAEKNAALAEKAYNQGDRSCCPFPSLPALTRLSYLRN